MGRHWGHISVTCSILALCSAFAGTASFANGGREEAIELVRSASQRIHAALGERVSLELVQSELQAATCFRLNRVTDDRKLLEALEASWTAETERWAGAHGRSPETFRSWLESVLIAETPRPRAQAPAAIPVLAPPVVSRPRVTIIRPKVQADEVLALAIDELPSLPPRPTVRKGTNEYERGLGPLAMRRILAVQPGDHFLLLGAGDCTFGSELAGLREVPKTLSIRARQINAMQTRPLITAFERESQVASQGNLSVVQGRPFEATPAQVLLAGRSPVTVVLDNWGEIARSARPDLVYARLSEMTTDGAEIFLRLGARDGGPSLYLTVVKTKSGQEVPLPDWIADNVKGFTHEFSENDKVLHSVRQESVPFSAPELGLLRWENTDAVPPVRILYER